MYYFNSSVPQDVKPLEEGVLHTISFPNVVPLHSQCLPFTPLVERPMSLCTPTPPKVAQEIKCDYQFHSRIYFTQEQGGKQGEKRHVKIVQSSYFAA